MAAPIDEYEDRKRQLELFHLRLQIVYAAIKIVTAVVAGGGIILGFVALLLKYLPQLPH